MSSNDNDLLARELHQRSEEMAGTSIGLDAVKRRARGIRRMRMALGGAAAAVVLAVAVPVGVSVTGSVGTIAPQPANPSPTGVPSPTVTDDAEPQPRPDGTFALTIRDLPPGASAGVSYVVNKGDQLVTPEGTFDLPKAYTMITPYAGGWLGTYTDVETLNDDLEVTSARRGSTTIAVNREHTRVAFVERTSPTERMLFDAPTDGTDPLSWTISVSPEEDLAPVGFLDRDTVVYQSQVDELVGFATVGGEVTQIEGFNWLTDVSEAAGLVAGQTSYGVDRECWGVRDPRSRTTDPLWQTCDYSRFRFSPDGRYVAAYASAFDGMGSPTLTILDARTGDVVTEFSPDRGGRQVVAVQLMTWEDDDSVLALVSEGVDQAMVRADVDGSLEAVTEPQEMHDMSIALWFAETSHSF